MKKWSREDWFSVIAGPILVALLVGWLSSEDYDMYGSIYLYATYIGVACLLIQITMVIIPGSRLAKWIIWFVLLFAAQSLYRELSL